jgi:hypothetical protein
MCIDYKDTQLCKCHRDFYFLVCVILTRMTMRNAFLLRCDTVLYGKELQMFRRLAHTLQINLPNFLRNNSHSVTEYTVLPHRNSDIQLVTNLICLKKT